MTPLTMIGHTYTQAFKALTGKFRHYEVMVFLEHGRCIIAVPMEGEKKAYSYIEYSNTSHLISLLTLYEKMQRYNTAPNEIDITEEDTKSIIEWCEIYGLPMEMDFGDVNSNSLWMKYRKIGFSISTFYRLLHELYTTYSLWKRIYKNDMDNSNYYVKNNVSIEQCREFLQGHMITLSIRVSPDFSVDPPSFFLECDNLLAVAKAQLLFICMSADGSGMGVCTVCSAPFQKMRKNHVLCEQCQRTKYQRSRDKKRATNSAPQVPDDELDH